MIPGLGRSPGKGRGNPLQYSYLENPLDRGAWWITVHGVTKESDTTEMTQHTHRRTQLPPPYQLQASPGCISTQRTGRQEEPQFPEGQLSRAGRDSCAEACAEAELIQGLGIQIPNVTRAQGRFSRGNQKLEMPRGFARGNTKTGSRYMVVPERARMLRSLI